MIDERPLRAGEIWVRREGDETAVFDRASGKLIQLNPTALAIWEMCDGETELEEIAGAIAELTGRERSMVTAEVQTTVSTLADLQLIETR